MAPIGAGKKAALVVVMACLTDSFREQYGGAGIPQKIAKSSGDKAHILKLKIEQDN